MRPDGQRGTGMIEITVALLVLSIGTLGLARGQLAARQHSHAALQRSEALFRTVGLAELIHSNPAALQSYELDSATAPDAPAVDCADQSCDAMQWSAWNRWQWWMELKGARAQDSQGSYVAGLPQPLACISVNGRNMALRLSWRVQGGFESGNCSDELTAEGRANLLLNVLPGEDR